MRDALTCRSPNGKNKWSPLFNYGSDDPSRLIIPNDSELELLSGDGEATLPLLVGTPSMGVNFWGASPLYETGSLKETNMPSG